MSDKYEELNSRYQVYVCAVLREQSARREADAAWDDYVRVRDKLAEREIVNPLSRTEKGEDA